MDSSKIFCIFMIFVILIIMLIRVTCVSKFNDSILIENYENENNNDNNNDNNKDNNNDNNNDNKNEDKNINSPKFLFGVNYNSALENLRNDKQIKNRVNCHSAPLWWYPKDSYDPNKFKSKYYPDYFDKNLNYWGNAQERFWDFKTVRDTFTII